MNYSMEFESYMFVEYIHSHMEWKDVTSARYDHLNFDSNSVYDDIHCSHSIDGVPRTIHRFHNHGEWHHSVATTFDPTHPPHRIDSPLHDHDFYSTLLSNIPLHIHGNIHSFSYRTHDNASHEQGPGELAETLHLDPWYAEVAKATLHELRVYFNFLFVKGGGMEGKETDGCMVRNSTRHRCLLRRFRSRPRDKPVSRHKKAITRAQNDIDEF